MNRISVCMATYNGGLFIEKQLKSILNQLGPSDEIIISDDSSKDNTLELIQSMGDPRVIVYADQQFRSPVFNFENAVRHATGDFIFLADQDDVWHEGKVSGVVELLQHHDLVLSDCIVVNQRGEILHSSFFKYRNSHPGFIRNIIKNSYVGCCMAFRRNIVTYILPFPSAIYMHDWWIGLLVEAKGSVCFDPVRRIYYVRHGNNASPTGEGQLAIAKQVSNRFTMLLAVLRRLLLTN